MRLLRRFRRSSLSCQLAVIGVLAVVIVVLKSHLQADTIDEKILLHNLRKELHRMEGHDVGKENSRTEIPLSTKSMCGNIEPCPVGQFAYKIQTGFQNKHRPEMCLDDDYGVFPQIEMGRGLNILHIDEHTKKVKRKRSFDTYLHGNQKVSEQVRNSADLIAFLDGVPPRDVIMAVVFDDATNRLAPEAVRMFEDHFGSRQAHVLGYRSMWAFIGQKYVQHDGEHEKYTMKKPNEEWGAQTNVQGCFSIPLTPKKESSKNEGMPYQNLCMVPRVCESNEVAVHVESGHLSKKAKIYPKVCVDGKTILSDHKIEKVNPAKRGLNFLVVDPETAQVVSSGSFDTYDSALHDTKCADFLRSVGPGMMVIGTTFDEASRQLGYDTKRELQRLGAIKIQDLGYREMWAFVGQKGIKGLTPYEKVSEDFIDGWGVKAEIWQCIPKFINGTSMTDTKMGLKKKTEFCQKYHPNFREMCSPVNIHRPVVPLQLDDESLASNPAYSTPIIVVPGSDLEALQLTLESLIAVPGLQNHLVVVVLEGNFAQPNELVGVYGFRVHYIKAKSQYIYTLLSGMEEAMGLFPKNEYFIIIEEYVEVAPDFLRYFSQTMHLLEDETILSISAWNEHGFKHTSGDTGLLYRTDVFPGYGWLLRRTVWKNEIKKNEMTCCVDQTWRGWLRDDSRKKRESIVPDVSRVKRSIKPGIYEDRPFLEEYLSNRTMTSDPSTEPSRAFYLKQAEYENYIKQLIKEGIPLDRNLLIGCETVGKTSLNLSEFSRGAYTLFYRQDSATDYRVLVKLSKCLGIYIYNDDTVRGLHNGVLRLVYQGQQLLLIGTKSPYYQYKPINAVPY
ncbi:protein O-linked-mannose beta-1,2-N-acetylglucosaminyltransferase 1-like isoform X1 [Lytechinus variegatus]|uniref:protein O-linked-mannose beta-1,2-N-acetylglucosaminyltransferase 1-like isoform X1 n=1 Tax=Lytechinus variegatus TaxID=7654 RepID=UPI001BB278F8|nr:protein O-linked-mannose beta-1,2-N-acetylglucosaminyltransferase 1-like isoform X1 [Lytechinus variegatus]